MAKRKLQRFAENETFPHFFQPNRDQLLQGFELQGNWDSKFFNNNNPIIIELGCGKGEYVIDLSTRYPNCNFIGIDKKGARMWCGAKRSNTEQRKNVAFLRIMGENLTLAFANNEVSEIWITFPEPHLNSPRLHKRFTSPRYLERFKQILKPEGIIHLKTDNDEFYNYTLEMITLYRHQLLFNTDDLYADTRQFDIEDVIAVRTHYEKMWLEQGLKIKYLRFKLS